MADLKEMCKSQVDPSEHATQMLMLLQRIQLDASQVKAMAESGHYNVQEVLQLKRDIQKDMELFNARLVFACNDLENCARGLPILKDEE